MNINIIFKGYKYKSKCIKIVIFYLKKLQIFKRYLTNLKRFYLSLYKMIDIYI